MHDMLKGSSSDVIAANAKALRKQGMSEKQALHLALKYSRKSGIEPAAYAYGDGN